MMNLPGRLRAKLAAETDPRAIEAMLEAEVRLIAQTMQKEARQLLVPPGQRNDTAEDDA